MIFFPHRPWGKNIKLKKSSYCSLQGNPANFYLPAAEPSYYCHSKYSTLVLILPSWIISRIAFLFLDMGVYLLFSCQIHIQHWKLFCCGFGFFGLWVVVVIFSFNFLFCLFVWRGFCCLFLFVVSPHPPKWKKIIFLSTWDLFTL